MRIITCYLPHKTQTNQKKMAMMIPSQSYSYSCIVISLYYSLFLISFVLHTLASPTLHHCHHSQRDALLEFKNEFHVDAALDSWNKSRDCCSWKGITCDAKSGKWLDLSSNALQGPLPRWICKLTSVEILILSNNLLNGSIPPCLKNSITSLTDLVLRNNSFSGMIPDIFNNATKLISLDVSRNQLEGELPKSFIHCTRLQLLNVRSNRIKDTFPFWLGPLPSLHVLILRSNKFHGPHVSTKFQSLRVIDVSHNDFTGTLPTFYFSEWLEMTTVGVEDDSFMISDVPYMGKVLNATASYISSMEIVNKGVEMEFKRINQDYKTVDFSGNSFCGNIPESIGLLKELRHLNLSGNAFTGNIPQSLGDLTKLESLDLSKNQLSGQIPQNLGGLSFVSTMNFSHNLLKGPVPRSTQFQGQSCSSFMDNLRLYGLEDICGETHVKNPVLEVPAEKEEQVVNWIAAVIAYGPGVFCGFVIGHILTSRKHKIVVTKSEVMFYKYSNEDDSFMISDVPYMGKVLNATASYISSMEIVNKGVEMEFKRINQDYKTVDFSGNSFCGNIPESIGLLKELRHLNLSGNAFTGNIPQSLGDLTKLESLDLSKNQLSGQIPQNLGGLSFVSTMNFSHNLLEGPVPRSTQFQGQSCSSFMDNLKLYGLEDICGETHMKNPVLEVPAAKEEQVVNWIAAVIAYGPGVFSGFVIGHILTSRKHKIVVTKSLTPLKVSKTLPRTEKGKRDAMECFRVSPPIPKLSFFSNSRNSTSQRFIIPSCRERRNRDEPLSTSSPYSILGVEPNCSSLELKAAFRAKVKQYHPDVNREGSSSDVMIRRIIQAYEVLTNTSRAEIIEGECLDPFDNPECEALDVFVNEVLCFGKRCSYPCFKTASHVFSCDSTGTARAMSQGRGEDYRVQSAVNQCPRSCIHYVTPSQRIILEELLDSVLDKPYDCSAEAELLYALIVKAQFENNRYRKPKKKQPESSSKHVDWL
ncbi:hypothetical protein IGI04_004058 [Brassica rapa subsp. trilocularis]|uniref:J domain-containing protein n=1 Tax=Brassica rapa subsp. trilocularis TaxID=1813537 RepID=A0ABQ7P067_BRACM|nr:hypothetical protein IGI04_004058 [Brassica rapa subsp. trilocularis]